MAKKEYIGVALDGQLLKVAHLRIERKKLHLLRVDQVSLTEKITSQTASKERAGVEAEVEADSVFGLEDNMEEPVSDSENEDDTDLLNEDIFEGIEEDISDMASEEMTGQGETNDRILSNLLSSFSTKRVDVGLNIAAGETIYQIVDDIDYSAVKRKDVVEDIESRLAMIYGTPKSSDHYAYEIREDGSILLASHEDEPYLLSLLNKVRDTYSGKIFVHDIVPDEVILAGLVRANYALEEDEITGIVEFSPKSCRVIFMKGNRILEVSPMIPEGTQSKKFLNTVFSKILFQLDTGSLPGLDRLIIANNVLGEKAIKFFKENFPGISVENLYFDPGLFVLSEHMDRTSINGFTTAIGAAWATSGYTAEKFPPLSFLPKYVADRQKVFKLKWHGVVLLMLIAVTPVLFNHFYQQNQDRIETLTSELNRTNRTIASLEPTVQAVHELNNNIAQLKEKLVLLDTLSYGTRSWSTYLELVNNGVRDVGSTWLTTFRASENGLVIHGISLYRDRIPQIVNLFNKATLMQVRTEEMRELTIYRFTMSVDDIVKDKSLISPPKSPALRKVLNTTVE